MEKPSRFDEALSKLDPESRRVIDLWIEGLSHSEVAEILGLTERACAIVRLRAIEQVRRLMGQESLIGEEWN